MAILVKQLKYLLIILIILVLSGVIGFMIIKRIDFLSAFILTLETFAYMVEPEKSIAGRILQTYLLIFGIFFLWFVMWTIFDILLGGQLGYSIKMANINKKIERLKDHYIICGAGRVGMRVAEELKRRKKNFVIAERDLELVNKLKDKDYLVVHGTSTDEDTLIKAGIRKAKYLIAATGDDAKNILIILTAKELNPNIKIGARATNESIVKKLKHAGADYIVLPEVLGGIELVDEIISE